MKLRIRFGKEGAVRFIGHLDIMRYFQKALRRAKFDLTYTKGFHPHPVMSFASPLGLGLESCGEYMDIEVDSMTSLSQMQESLQGEMAEGIRIFHISLLRDDARNAMSSLAAADYLVRLQEEGADEPSGQRAGIPSRDQLADMIRSFLDRDQVLTEKKTKRGTAQIDLRPLVHELTLQEDGSLFMKLHASSAANVKPELVLSELTGNRDWLDRPAMLQICRLEMYAQEGPEDAPVFIPFCQYQAAEGTD